MSGANVCVGYWSVLQSLEFLAQQSSYFVIHHSLWLEIFIAINFHLPTGLICIVRTLWDFILTLIFPFSLLEFILWGTPVSSMDWVPLCGAVHKRDSFVAKELFWSRRHHNVVSVWLSMHSSLCWGLQWALVRFPQHLNCTPSTNKQTNDNKQKKANKNEPNNQTNKDPQSL